MGAKALVWMALLLTAMTASGCTAWTWGWNDSGDRGDGTSSREAVPTPTEPVGTSPFTVLEAGDLLTCGIQGDASLWCWGTFDRYPPLGSPGTGYANVLERPERIGSADWVDVSIPMDRGPFDSFTACGIQADQTLWCWNDGPSSLSRFDSPALPASNTRWADISVGSGHVCGIVSDRSLWCWGNNSFGQIGDGVIGGTVDTPTRIGDPSDQWVQVTTGIFHTCALKADRSLWCWGNNNQGQLGHGEDVDFDNEPLPVFVDAGPWDTVVGGSSATCGLKQDTTLWCWGKSFGGGQIGNGFALDRNVPTLISFESFQDVDLGTGFGCAIHTDGSRWCWGDRSLGDGRLLGPDVLAPSRLDEGPWTIVATGVNHGCAVDGASASTPSCWGRGEQGQLGNGGVGITPAAISGRWSDVSTSGGHTCAVAEVDGTLWCWGNTLRVEQNGQFLEELPGDRSPVRIGQDAWLDVDGSCAIRDDATLWCWGDDREGRPVPSQLGTATWAVVSASSDTPCGIQTDGSLWCWGSNLRGAVGDGTTTFRPEPTLVAVADPALDWSDVSVGTDHACALGADSSVWCWGFNDAGQVGTDLVNGSVSRPIQVAGQWTAVDVGGFVSCAIATDDSVWCWGFGAGGLSGSFGAVPTPTRFGTASWSQISVGQGHRCGIQTDASLWCWGSNSNGQLGTGNLSNPADADGPVAIRPDLTWKQVDAGTWTSIAIQQN